MDQQSLLPALQIGIRLGVEVPHPAAAGGGGDISSMLPARGQAVAVARRRGVDVVGRGHRVVVALGQRWRRREARRGHRRSRDNVVTRPGQEKAGLGCPSLQRRADVLGWRLVAVDRLGR